MYISKVILKNIRGFSDLQFDLAREDGTYAGWTVFTGDNGSGKSTLLRDDCGGVGRKDAARALQPSFLGWIRDGATNEQSSSYKSCASEDDDSSSGSGKLPADNFPAKLELRNGGREPALTAVVPRGNRKRYLKPETNASGLPTCEGWFSCGYGPFRRVFGASPEATRQMVASTSERFVTMFQEAASSSRSRSWMRDLKYKELENREAEREQLEMLLEILQDDSCPIR